MIPIGHHSVPRPGNSHGSQYSKEAFLRNLLVSLVLQCIVCSTICIMNLSNRSAAGGDCNERHEESV